MHPDRWAKIVTQWVPEDGRRNLDRPRKRWRGDLDAFDGDWPNLAQYRDAWKDVKENLAQQWDNIGLIFIPLPAFQHFIWPPSYCLLADICNHTWIPECGVENVTGSAQYRMFIDECDMFEYNCDNERSFEITNYSICWLIPPSCPTQSKTKNFYRMGNYRFVLEGRRLIYDPTSPTTKAPPVPLPSRMLHGKRRHTPEANKRRYRFKRLGISSPCGACHTRGQTVHMKTKRTFRRKKSININTLKKTIPMTSVLITKRPYFGVVYKRLTVIKDGKVMVKVIKGTATTDDSDFIQ